MEVVFKEAEKKVAGFQRLQGDSYKRACSRYAEMKPGNKWALRQQFHQEALDILAAITSSSSPKGGLLARPGLMFCYLPTV